MLKYTLLGFLNYQPQTGYELKTQMDHSTAYFWHAKQSQIYTTLKRLEADGLVTSTVEEQEGRPNRRVYAITDAGRADLQGWLKRPLTEIDPRKETFLLKLFFSGDLDKATLVTQLRLLRELHSAQYDLYRGEVAAGTQEHLNDPTLRNHAMLWNATRRMGEYFEEAVINWIDETLAMIEAEFE